MSSTNSKLRLIAAFAALATLALAVSCRGFFVNPTLTSIAISPTTPQVAVNTTLTLQVFGTYDDGSRNQVKSGISWSSDTPSVAPIDPNTGIMTGLALGSATITADAEGLSATANATVYLSGITAITITPNTKTLSATSGSPADFTASATANGSQQDITETASWNLTPTTTDVTCTYVAPYEECTADSSAIAQSYTLTASYPGTTIVGTATLTVTNP